MSTRAQLLTEVASSFPTNGANAITAVALRNQQNDVINSAWIPSTDGIPISSVLTGNQIWVDAVNGNDGTGIIGRLDKPFKTLDAAAAVLVSGYTVMVSPGAYTPSANLCVDGSAYYFFPGCSITYAPSLIEHALFDMGAISASTFYVLGNANFILAGARDIGFVTLFGNTGTSYPSVSPTKGRFECNDVTDISTGGNYTVDFSTDTNSSVFTFNFKGLFQGAPNIASSTDLSIHFGVAIMPYGGLNGSTYIDCLTCTGEVNFEGSCVIVNCKNVIANVGGGAFTILGVVDATNTTRIRVSNPSWLSGYFVSDGNPIVTLNTAGPVTINGILDTSAHASVFPIVANVDAATINTNGLGFRMGGTPAIHCVSLSGGVSTLTVNNYGAIAGTVGMPSGATVIGGILTINPSL